MTKYCSALNCKNDSGNTSTEKKSFYKFPLQDPARLQNWLKNMDREDWTPSRHQYLCHEHFLPSCFTVRWGIRYLDNTAVPTIFDLSDNKAKRKGVDHFERRAKRKRSSGGVEKPTPQDPASHAESLSIACPGPDTSVNTVQVYTISVTPAQPVLQLDARNIQSSALAGPVLEASPGLSGDFPVTLRPTVTTGPLGAAGEGDEPREVVVVMEAPPGGEAVGPGRIGADMMGEGQRPGPASVASAAPGCQVSLDPNTITIDNMYTVEVEELGEVIEAEVVEHHAAEEDLNDEDDELEEEDEEEEDDENGIEEEEPGVGVPLIAYFETIPNVLPTGPTALVNISPDTVLSSSVLGSRPIVSTVPIVSKHVPPTPTPTATPADSLILTLERLEDKRRDEDGDELSENCVELQGKRLEEHRYHKNNLSKEQLEAIVLELQKKVKVLQQRHRRHLDKLQGLETTVGQLRQTNLVNEERLQLLERAYLETSTVTEEGETVAIIYGDGNTTYLYAQPKTDHREVGRLL
ncbi:THAP domain-containing protein 5-like [Engraulis encrasicolus]|uniref:THAP domain-containing protein 5-like n=1 Tax=Engraulis encrasicolus TaxID=184585 RepID=UPI002FD25A6B